MKVIFTCGGTAGHVNPALALAQYMQERIENLDILFVGTPDGMERGLVEQAGYAFRGVEVGGFCRSLAPSGIRHNLKSVEHLLAAKGRVRAILRRSEAYQPTVLAYGDLTLDPGSGNLSCGSESIRLSGREFQIMELFMRSPRQVFSAERIMERVWGWDNEAEINVVWVNISNLRKKLKSIGSHVTLQANRGLGYVLEESV